jgi:hypothetical protein
MIRDQLLYSRAGARQFRVAKIIDANSRMPEQLISPSILDALNLPRVKRQIADLNGGRSGPQAAGPVVKLNHPKRLR